MSRRMTGPTPGKRARPPPRSAPPARRRETMYSRRVLTSLFVSTVLLSSGVAMAVEAPVGHELDRTRSASHATNDQDPFLVCADLSAQFDVGAKAHHGDPSWQEAKSMREEGGRLCRQGDPVAGVADLQTALAQIGMVPQPYY